MPRLTVVSWNELVRHLHHFGFEGPYRGGKHRVACCDLIHN